MILAVLAAPCPPPRDLKLSNWGPGKVILKKSIPTSICPLSTLWTLLRLPAPCGSGPTLLPALPPPASLLTS